MIEIEGEATLTPVCYSGTEFGALLEAAQKTGLPATLSWSAQLAESTYGYVVGAGGTRRTVAVVEEHSAKTVNWYAQTFRARRELSEPEIFDTVCHQMVEEAKETPLSREEVFATLDELFLGNRLALQYPSVILECNDPGRAEGSYVDMSRGDSRSIQAHYDKKIDDYGPKIDIADVVRESFKDDDSDVATLAHDVGVHMGDLPETFVVGEGQAFVVYRTRFGRYNWTFAPDGPLVDDMILINPEGSSKWYVGQVEVGEELTPEVIERFASYGFEHRNSDIPGVLIGGIIRRIDRSFVNPPKSYLLTNRLKAQMAEIRAMEGAKEERDRREEDVIEPYEFLDEPTI